MTVCGTKIYNPETHFCDARDKKTYKLVTIGEQIWMAENLNYDTKTTGSRCYNDESSHCDTYGKLYDWNQARIACPADWHLPTDDEWKILMNSIGSNINSNSDFIDAGTKLRSEDGWDLTSGTKGTNNYGFTALPGGYIGSNGESYFIEVGSYWWIDTEDIEDTNVAHNFSIFFTETYASIGLSNKPTLLSVRCLKN